MLKVSVATLCANIASRLFSPAFSMFQQSFRLGLGLSLLAFISVAAADEKIEFNRDIRPILSNKCYYCHGPDENNRQADLRLDTREGAIRSLGSYAAIVPGDSASSELLVRVGLDDDDEVMPPPEAKKERLTPAEIAKLKLWIDQGAEYQGHWAFEPLSREAPPVTKNATWPRNEIDQYILARLEHDNIQPSPEADREILIRRLYLDLIGLLPSPEQVAAFVADERPDAYELLVDELLANRHYGERWGRHWLDQARYADSHGYSVDSFRPMWPYRDWVINALNQDMPFDRFTIEQLAGDLLPDATKSQIAATAFHRNTLINQEGGTDAEQFRVEAVIDRVNTTGAVWLGLTVGCAQCHTHKFDPIPQVEFYQLTAFFNSGEDRNNTGPTISISPGELLHDEKSDPPPTEPSIKPSVEIGPPDWKPANYASFKTTGGATIEKLNDNSLLIRDTKPHDAYQVSFTTELETVSAIRVRVLPHESLPKNGPGKAGNGNFVVTDAKVFVDGKATPITGAVADHQQNGYPASATIDADPKSGWAINVAGGSKVKMNAPHEITFVLAEPLQAKGKNIEVRLAHGLHADYLVGRLAVDLSTTAPLVPVTKPASAKPVALMVMRDLKKPRATYLLTRGDFTRPDKERGELTPGVLSAVPPKLEGAANRLDLARWLVNPKNPLTPRVTVNRVWMRYFGRGIVETEEDFGAQSALPTHPELLDSLASFFIKNGWSMKKLHRHIVTSATYRQSSNNRDDLRDIDAGNYLLARQSRIRLDAEIIRDAALTASGLLTDEIGGPSVTPPQPDGVYSFTQSKKSWKAAQGPDRYRRGLYTLFYRSSPYPLFTTFDAPDFQTVCTRRTRSNTPLQALNIANDPVFLEFAHALAQRVIEEVPGDSDAVLTERITRAFQLTLNRDPQPDELTILTKYARQQAAAKDQDPQAATPLEAIARALFNTDNFITRE